MKKENKDTIDLIVLLAKIGAIICIVGLLAILISFVIILLS